MLSHMVWAHWSDGYTKALCNVGGLGVEPRGLQLSFFYITNINQTMSDTWRPRIGPRVLTPFANKRTRVTSRFDSCQPMNAFHITFVRSYGPATSDRMDCTDCTDWYSQHQNFCLFDFPNRSLYLSLPTSV
jgi:hypothetical protein